MIKNNIQLFRNGQPIQTGAVVELPKEIAKQVHPIEGLSFFKQTIKSDEIGLSYKFAKEDMVVGLGETVKGLNKRGSELIAFCADEPEHHPNKKSLYGAHNFCDIRRTGKRLFYRFSREY